MIYFLLLFAYRLYGGKTTTNSFLPIGDFHSHNRSCEANLVAAYLMKPEHVGSGLDAAGRSWKLMGNEEKKALLNEEMKKMQRLPPNSSYASHRLRVLNKIHQLLSLQRTSAQDEELELLFSGLHL